MWQPFLLPIHTAYAKDPFLLLTPQPFFSFAPFYAIIAPYIKKEEGNTYGSDSALPE